MKQVLEYVRMHGLITQGDRVVVGLSGGADSVCLLFVLLEMQKEIDFDIYAVHINHHLRGQEALRDVSYVDNLCTTLRVPLEIMDVQVLDVAQEKKLGIEEAGRLVRYEAFEACAAKVQATKIALAHHQNDLAETMIYHLSRGTDLAGLAAIRPMRGKYIRPLLCMNRQDIENYLMVRNIEYVTDSTNLEDHYTRNRIRHHVVEYLEREVNDQTAAHMSETAQSLSEVYDYLLSEAKKKLEQYGRLEENRFFLEEKLFSEPKVLTGYVIRRAMGQLAGGLKDITREHIHMVQSLAEKQVGKEVHLPYGLVAKKEYSGICLGKEMQVSRIYQDDVQELSVPGDFQWNGYKISCEFDPQTEKEIPEKPCTKWLDYDKMKCNLVLRYRQSGDYLVVNSDGGKKKLKDYFIDLKIPREQRDSIPLLCCGQEVLWVVGYRISEAYKVTKETKTVLRIQIRGGIGHE